MGKKKSPTIFVESYHSPLGRIWFASDDAGIVELDEYFSGTLKAFETPARPSGTPFQKRVWRLLLKIPYGRTRSYGDLAARLGIPKGPRAVGQANGRNPVALLIP